MNFFLNKKVGVLGLSRTGISSIKFSIDGNCRDSLYVIYEEFSNKNEFRY